MKKIALSVCAGALMLPAVSMAAPPAGSVAVYLSNSSVDFGGGADDSGTGFGVSGWGMVNPNFFLHGEYQQASLDDFGIDVDQLRVGGGYVSEMSPGTMWLVKGEYVSFGFDDAVPDQSGFGVHGGIILMADQPFSVMGTVGYLTTDDTDGLELNISARYAFTKEWGGILGYRTYMGSVDPSGDVDISDMRIGVTYSF